MQSSSKKGKIASSFKLKASIYRKFMVYVVEHFGKKSLSSELDTAIKEYLEKRGVKVE